MASPKRGFAPERDVEFYQDVAALGLPKARAAIIKGIQEGLTDPKTIDAWCFNLQATVRRMVGRAPAKKVTQPEAKKKEGSPAETKVPREQPLKPSVSGFLKYAKFRDLTGTEGIRKYADVLKYLHEDTEWCIAEGKAIVEKLKADGWRGNPRDPLCVKLLSEAGLSVKEAEESTGWFPYFDIRSEKPAKGDKPGGDRKDPAGEALVLEMENQPAPKLAAEEVTGIVKAMAQRISVLEEEVIARNLIARKDFVNDLRMMFKQNDGLTLPEQFAGLSVALRNLNVISDEVFDTMEVDSERKLGDILGDVVTRLINKIGGQTKNELCQAVKSFGLKLRESTLPEDLVVYEFLATVCDHLYNVVDRTRDSREDKTKRLFRDVSTAAQKLLADALK